MTAKTGCTECGKALPPEAPQGLCPKCLMAAAIASASKGPPSRSATAPHRPAAAPKPAEPAPQPVDVDGFRRAAVELGLLSEPELGPFADAAEGDVARLAKILVEAGKLTPHQAGALAQGKGRGLAIGPYIVLEKRGQGGMGVVFKARHRDHGKVVALKILLPSFGRDREAVLRFRREFEVAAKLGHPNVVAAIEADEDRGVQYLTMEFVDGYDLDHLVREVQALPIKMALHCAIQAATGLAAAHASGIVHRDVKPGNLILDPDGNVRVLDLGLARIIEASSPLGKTANAPLTQSGAYMGTVDFMAPEQADDSKRADHRSDIYALGCTLYFLLSGRPPFVGDTLLKRLMAHQQQPAPSLYAAREGIPPALEAAYQSMMAKRPADRPRSMDVVIGLLEACRASADEARQETEGLRDFAETVMKRASPRVRGRSRDASVFARPSEVSGVRLGPDLSLEDVMDYRDEVKSGEIPEDKLPPMMPRLAAPTSSRKRPRRPGPGPKAIAAVVVAGLALAGYLASRREPPAASTGPSAGFSSSIVEAKKPRADRRFTPLFGGSDLSGWVAEGGRLDRWKVEGGVLSAEGRGEVGNRLVSRQAYTDVVFRFEFQINSGTTGAVVLAGQDGETPRHLLVNLGGENPYNDTGGIFRADGDQKGELTRPTTPARLKPGEPWDQMEVNLRGGLVTLSINGQIVQHWKDFSDISGPRRVGFQAEAGAIRFRNVEILDLRTFARADWPLRTLFFEDYDDPFQFKHADGVRGVEGGRFYYDFSKPGLTTWTCPPYGPPDSLSCENVGRVLGDSSRNLGSWGVQVIGRDRGLQVRLDNLGQLWIEPTAQSAREYPADPPRLGPVVHPAIKAGEQFNTLLLRLRRGRMEVLVNSAEVCKPLDLPWLRDVHVIRRGFFCEKGKVRPEFDRTEIKELPSGPTDDDPSPGFTPLFNGKDLAGWRGDVDAYEVRDGAVACKPGREGTVYYPKIYRDHVSRVEFRLSPGGNSGLAIHYPGEGLAWDSGLCEIQVLDDSAPKFAALDPRRYHGSAFGIAAARRGFLRPPGQWNTQDVTVRGTTVKVVLNGETILDADLGQDRELVADHVYRGRGRTAGYFGITCQPEGRVDYRRIEIRPLGETTPTPPPTTAAKPPAPTPDPAGPRVIFADDFVDKRGRLRESALEPDRAGSTAADRLGSMYGGGVYLIQEKVAGNSAYPLRANLVDFSCEATGKVLRGSPRADGSWGLLVMGEGRGLQVSINILGQLRVEPSFRAAGRYPNDPRIPPINHKAIRPGKEFNTLRLNVRRRRMEVLVNNAAVCDPIVVDWDLTPSVVEFGLFVDSLRVRAELDRVEFRELPPDRSAPARSPVGTWSHSVEGRKLVLRDGGVAEDSMFPTAAWSRSGSIFELRFRRPDVNELTDRVELDEDGYHYRGANRQDVGIRGFRVAPDAEFALTKPIITACLPLNPIPAGEFEMGTSPAQVEALLTQAPGARRDLLADEQPEHRVRVTRPFYLGATEVTVAQFREFATRANYKTEAERDSQGAMTPGEEGGYAATPKLTWRAPGFPQDDTHPVVNVSWNDAVAFCAWLSKVEGKDYRLPTEAEWEYAARANTTARFGAGDAPAALAGIANVADATAREKYPAWATYALRDHFAQTSPTAHLRPNAFGLYDMAGNVWEWCADRYDPAYYGRKVGDDPKGPAEGTRRVLRGGGWNYEPASGRPADRAGEPPDRRFTAVGFRVARDLTPAERAPSAPPSSGP